MVLSLLIRRVVKFLRRIKRIVFFDESEVIYNGRTYRSYWDEFYGNDCRPFFCRTIVKTYARIAYITGGFRPDEFVLYGLESQRIEDSKRYLSQKKKDQILVLYYGSKCGDILGLLKDKFVFYSCLKEFFKRDVTYVKGPEDRLSFLSFCARHHDIFTKLNKGSCGNGAKKFSIRDDDQANEVFDELISTGEWIIEEVISQNSIISAFNSFSINTVRFPSFKKNGIVKCVYPCMRFGRAGSIVDNAGQGGVFVSIDQVSGEIISDAFDEKGNVYVSHPDSEVPFRGFVVPQWENLKELVKKAHLALPDDQVYVAFDFALSENGWCIVEGNWGDWILQQVSLRKGLKNEFVSFLIGGN